MLKFMCPLIVVDDIEHSRHFYEQLLGQKVKFDFGENVQFEGDFSIHLKSHYQSLLGDANQYPVTRKAHWGELYFETDDLESIHQTLKDSEVQFIHSIRERPWGQRMITLYDPDYHIVEIGESMETVICRFHEQGMSLDLISEKSSMPRDFVEDVINERS